MDEMTAPAPAEQSPVAESETPSTLGVDGGESPAPPAPKEAPTRLEALEKAFEGFDDEPDAAPKEAKAEPAPDADGRLRGADGKFVAKEGAETRPEVQEGEPAAEAEDADKTPISEAPSRFSPDAKEAWKDAPEAVRGEIQRAITELETGLQQKDGQLAPLKQFFDMAEQHGVQVHDVLGKYVGMEQLLAKDVTQGLNAIANNMGLTLNDMLAQVAGQQSPEGEAAAKDREILALNQKIDELSGQVGQVSQTFQQQQESNIMQGVEKFAADNPRFDELATEITQLLSTGYATDLQDAYTKADRLNPAPQPAAPQPPAPPAQPRVARSVTGAPNAGSNPRNLQPSANRTEALTRAFQQTGLS